MKTILISAYACEPNKGSEPGVGWNWMKEIAKNNKVIVITRLNNKNIIEDELKFNSNQYNNISFYYCDVPKRLSFWKKGQRGLHLYYFLWQIECYKLSKLIMKNIKVDIALGLTFGNMWLPTFMHKLPCKFIWGPLGGGEGVPIKLWKKLPTKQKLVEIIRIINKYLPLTNIWFYSICKKSDYILVRTNDSFNCIPKKYRSKCDIIIETGVSVEECEELNRRAKEIEPKYDFIFIGRLVPFKMADIAIKAFANIAKENSNINFHIVGNGPCLNEYKILIERLEMERQIILHGEVDRNDALEMLMSSKAFLFPSAREGGAWVLFEAMMCSKPIICLDTSGMNVVVTNETGIKVPVNDYDKVVQDFSMAIKEFLDKPDNALYRGINGYERVKSEFEWKSKGKFISKIIEKIYE